MTRTVLILNGSPRQKGNTAALVEQAAAGVRSSGAQAEVFFLQDMNIQPCNACDACQENGGNPCILEDDMQSIYPWLRQADAVVVASPVYWFTLSAQSKLCIDRWYALESPQGNVLKGKQFGLLLAYGDSDPFTSGGINAIRTFQDMTRYLKAELVGVAHGSASEAGEIRNRTDVMEAAYRLGEKLGKGS